MIYICTAPDQHWLLKKRAEMMQHAIFYKRPIKNGVSVTTFRCSKREKEMLLSRRIKRG